MTDPRHPTARFLISHPAHFIALGLGSGLAHVAPGTWGTLAGWLLFAVLSLGLHGVAWVALLGLAFVIGVWACRVTGRDLGVADHGAMVWDEMVAIWCVLVMLPANWHWQLLGVVLFRFFDIVKPPPIRFFDAHIHGGFGVMWDDLVAAFYTLLLMAVLMRLGVLHGR